MAPALSEQITKACICPSESGVIQSSKGAGWHCGGFTEQTSLPQGCYCFLTSPSSSEGVSYDYFGDGSSNFYSRQSPTASSPSSVDKSKYSSLSPTYSNCGPPDLDVLEFLSPSAKQVFNVLETDGPLTQKDLIYRTNLDPRTVRKALDKLKGEDILEERFCFRDARQSLYSISGVITK